MTPFHEIPQEQRFSPNHAMDPPRHLIESRTNIRGLADPAKQNPEKNGRTYKKRQKKWMLRQIHRVSGLSL
ncbi:MAG: hypothetical protein GXY54_11915 [Deltaproteobacteria bacterium]|nr:hypothetical protein [Deltaproteobacteria bacterium]